MIYAANFTEVNSLDNPSCIWKCHPDLMRSLIINIHSTEKTFLPRPVLSRISIVLSIPYRRAAWGNGKQSLQRASEKSGGTLVDWYLWTCLPSLQPSLSNQYRICNLQTNLFRRHEERVRLLGLLSSCYKRCISQTFCFPPFWLKVELIQVHA